MRDYERAAAHSVVVSPTLKPPSTRPCYVICKRIRCKRNFFDFPPRSGFRATYSQSVSYYLGTNLEQASSYRMISTNNVWSAAQLQGESVGEEQSLRKCIRPLVEIISPGQVLRACQSICTVRSVALFETIFGIRLWTRRCDCSFILAASCRPR